MAKVQTMYRGDLQPPLEGVCTGKDGRTPQDFSGAQAITLRLTDQAGERVVDDQGVAVVGSPKAGAWRYDWQPGDTDEEGVLDGEITATLADGDPFTFGGFQVVIRKRKGET